jgi:hypothetical protein
MCAKKWLVQGSSKFVVSDLGSLFKASGVLKGRMIGGMFEVTSICMIYSATSSELKLLSRCRRPWPPANWILWSNSRDAMVCRKERSEVALVGSVAYHSPRQVCRAVQL